MSDLNTRSTVTLLVNGQQAEQTLQQLRQQALQLEGAIAKAAAAGNKTELKHLRSEMASTKKQIRDIETSTMQVEQVMRRLDKASPRELNKTLQTLNRQLEYMERGSEAWNTHIEKIRQVKAEIATINQQVRTQEGFWTRMNRTINDWQTTIMGAAAAVTGLVMAGRKAVSLYAEMDEQLADTRKYTGLTVEQVEELNESFKKMDTRTSREELNLLAQEAGRLGKNTIKDVKGYVEAADIINVALVDLGEGATQTIAKLANIFRVEEKLGTKKAMLSVGSAVNVLSQNCTASKQYLVEFTQRMAGIGAQADLTIPQLLAFGATLDANGQKTEMSASALGKLTMMLFQKPKEIAAQVGLDVNKFTKTLKRSTNEGLLMFLERIQQMGSKDGLAVLAPLFKDIGAEGVRMSQVLATLAEHLDMVKWEQQEANKAFKEATSASHEYEIFNNTVQAGLDKARKRVHELGVQLGEKLMPIMRHVMSSTTLLMRLLNVIVDFIIKYKTELITLTAAITTYNLVLNATAIWQKAVNVCISAGHLIAKGYTTVVNTLTAAKIALNVVLAKLQRNWAKQSSLMQDAKNAGLSLTKGYAAIAAAIVVLGTAIYSLIKKHKEEKKALEEKRQAALQYEKAATDLTQKTAENSAKEMAALKTVYEQAIREANAKDVRRKAAEKLQKIYPAYFSNMTTEQIMLGQAKTKYDELCTSILAVAKARAAAEKIEENMKEIIKLEGELANGEVWLKNANDRVEKSQAAYEEAKQTAQTRVDELPVWADSKDMGVMQQGSYMEASAKAEELSKNQYNQKHAQKYVDEHKKKIEVLTKANNTLANIYGSQEGFNIADNLPSIPTYGKGGSDNYTYSGGDEGGSSKSENDKFAKEKAWKAKQEALNRIAYATGKKDFETYSKRMIQIEQEFYQKELKHKDLTEQEKLEIQAKFEEAKKKSTETASKFTLEEENATYQESLAILKQMYVDDKITIEQYNKDAKLLELQHLREVKNIYKEGSKERLAAERAYENALFEDKKEKMKQQEELEKQHAEKMKKLKEDIFGLNPSERQAAFNEVLGYLNAVKIAELQAAGDNAKEKLRIEKAFQKAKYALMKQYNIEGANENMNFMEKMNDGILDFLDSDLGNAITGSMEMLTNSMSSMFSGLSSLIQAETDIQTSAIEAKYDREISLAEGNTYRVKQLEQQKQDEIAAVKNEASKKMYAMEVTQAVAQTAISAINAYSSAAAVPVIGYILAPIAAAMAIAAGGIQIAALKKQQEAAAAKGYSSGGFTPDGDVDEAVGVVHAGEWVASQKLTKNPKTRPVLEALEKVQRTNSIGNIDTESVSQSITAPVRLANYADNMQRSPQKVIVENNTAAAPSPSLSEYADTMKQLQQRLEEPFITVNTVTGDFGSKKAQDDYEKLIRNKTPKSRR